MTRVLIVDDLEQNRYMLRALLRGSGFETDEAANGVEALERARQRAPDICVSDLLMPGMDGFDLLREWKADLQLASIPFIVYTATYTDPEDERLVMALGADAFLVKPVEPEEFVARLEAVLATVREAPPRAPIATAEQAREAHEKALARKLERKVMQLEKANLELSIRQAELQHAAAWRDAVLSAADLAIVSTDVDSVIRTFNPAAEQMWGYRADEVIGRLEPEVLRFVPEGEPPDGDGAPLATLAAEGRSEVRDWTIRCKDATARPIGLTVRQMHDALGEPLGFLAIATDLTQHRSDDARRRLQAAALDAAANAIVITSPDGTIEWVNPAFCTLSGYSADEVLKANPRILKSGVHDADFYANMWKTILAGEVWRAETVNRRKDGTLWHEEQTVTPVRDADGRIGHFIAIKSDITQRKQDELERWTLQDQLRASERLQAVGSLAGGIAHDFNNLLAVIMMYGDWIAQSVDETNPLHADALEIRAASERGADLTSQLLAFSRRKVMRETTFDLNVVMRGLEKMLQRLLGGQIELDVLTDADPAVLTADQSQVEQVIMNLLVNARDAMPEGGQIAVKTSKVVIDEAEVCLGPGSYVALEVTDTGTGIEQSTLDRIFEPFFSTKPRGRGTGLGLATVHGIVEQCGGRVSVRSEVGQGTAFTVLLPLSSGTPDARSESREVSTSATGAETILVADDEPAVRKIAERLLSASGYHVLLASDGIAALSAAESHSGTIHLVLTDVSMPGLGGRGVVEELSRTRPGVKAIFMSGFADDAIMADGALEPGLHFIGKPFGVVELLHKIRDVLDE